VKVGDLVKYCAITAIPRRHPYNPNEERGLVIETRTNKNGHAQCYVVWFTCDNRGWWNRENLEVISESR
jgi:hypothetical protein